MKNFSTLFVPVSGVGMTLVVVVLYVYQPGWLWTLNHKIYDIVLQQGHTEEISGAVAIVDLDEDSLRRYGQWPWPRYRMALLLENLRQAGVRAVGMDVLFAEADRSSPCVLKHELKKDLDIDLGFSGLPEALSDNDRIFAQTLAKGPFVLGFFFDFEQAGTPEGDAHLQDINPAVVSSDKDLVPEHFLISAPAVLSPLKTLCDAVPATGFINTIRDRDGILRKTPILMSYQDKVYANLGFSVLLTAMGRPQCVVKMSSDGVESIRFGKTVVPLDKHGRFWLHYRGPRQTFPYISAGDILDGTVRSDQLRGKIILIGTSAAGLHDLRTTPFDSEFPGVEAHATLIDTILTGDFITVPDWLPGMELCLTLMAGLVTTILVCWLSAWYILPVILVFVGICLYGSLWSFAQYQFFFSPLFPVLSTGVNFSLLSFLKFLRTDQQKRFLRQAFSKYVSKSVADRIVESPELLSLEGEEKEVSILFSDIRGFTSLSERLTPAQITSLLQSFLTPMTKVIVDNQGTLDKFIGDAVMAFWNAPLDVKDHRKHAVTAGLAMLDALKVLNRTFQADYGLTLKIGIGLHAGTVSVGNMGTEDLFDYTIIGDSVNLTSRLEGLTKYYGVPLVVSDALAEVSIDGYSLQELDKVTVKGKEKPVQLFSYRRNKEIGPDELKKWTEALHLYRNRDFQASLGLIETLVESLSDYYPYTLYAKRCREFLVHPPSENWDSVYSHVSK